MKTLFDILDVLYPVIHVTAVTSLIGGGVYRNRKPPNSDAQDIVILVLTTGQVDAGEVQRGTVFVNCYARNLNGRPDEAKLAAVAAAVIAKLQAYSSASTYYTLDVVSQNLLPDKDQPDMSYVSIRVNYNSEP